MHEIKRVIGLAVGLWLVTASAWATAASANISHSYKSVKSIARGSIVSLDAGRIGYVVAAKSDNANRLLGVAVSGDDSLIALSENNGSVMVATTGSSEVLVSDLGGSIQVGDQIAPTPFEGIGAKAGFASRIIGTAQTAFSDKSPHITRQITDKQRKVQDIKVGYVRLNIAVGTSSNQAGSKKLSVLQRIGRSLTGKTISSSRLIVSAIIALIAIVALITLLHAAIYGSLVSVGRNPLAKSAVFKALAFVMLIALTTAVVASAAILFLLQ